MNIKLPLYLTRLALGGFAGALALAPIAAHAARICVNARSDSSCPYHTIQEGIDAAQNAGDVVTVADGTYTENVVISAGGITLKGSAAAIINADDPNTGPGVTVSANDVTIKGLTITNGAAQSILLSSGVTGTVIRGVTMKNPTGDCIRGGIGNDTVLIDNSLFNGCGAMGVNLTGDTAQLQNNTLNHTGSTGLNITGDDTTITGNTLTNIAGKGIYIDGDNPTASDNTIKWSNGHGIDIYRTAGLITTPTASGNTLLNINGYGIHVSANTAGSASAKLSNNTINTTASDAINLDNTGTHTDPTITKNQISNTATGYGIYANDTSAALVSGNDLSNIGGTRHGIYLLGINTATPTITNNTLTGISADAINVPQTTNPTITYNVVKTSLGYGINVSCYVTCTDGLVSFNNVSGSGNAGIYVWTNNTGVYLSRNKITHARTIGLDIAGTGGVTASKNRLTDIGYGTGSSCIRVKGSTHRIQSNTLSGCSANGIQLYDVVGPGATDVSLNTISDVAGNGITFYDSNNADNNNYTLSSNTIKRVDGYGFRLASKISGIGVLITANKATDTGLERICTANNAWNDGELNNFTGSTLIPPGECPLDRN